LLRTERLLLRRPTLDDVEAFTPMLKDPEVMRFLGGVEDDVEGRIAIWVEGWKRYPAGKFIAERRADGAPVGRIGFNFYDPVAWTLSTAPNALPELGWALLREHWGQGYATEAATAIRDWFAASRVISLIAPDNLRSQRVAGRLGAVPTESVTLFDSSEAVVWLHPQRSRPSASSSADRG
jgi:RimJ/RimL family protein N-acetyltransferase